MRSGRCARRPARDGAPSPGRVAGVALAFAVLRELGEVAHVAVEDRLDLRIGLTGLLRGVQRERSRREGRAKGLGEGRSGGRCGARLKSCLSDWTSR
jgi:hypothetical protein